MHATAEMVPGTASTNLLLGRGALQVHLLLLPGADLVPGRWMRMHIMLKSRELKHNMFMRRDNYIITGPTSFIHTDTYLPTIRTDRAPTQADERCDKVRARTCTPLVMSSTEANSSGRWL